MSRVFWFVEYIPGGEVLKPNFSRSVRRERGRGEEIAKGGREIEEGFLWQYSKKFSLISMF